MAHLVFANTQPKVVKPIEPFFTNALTAISPKKT